MQSPRWITLMFFAIVTLLSFALHAYIWVRMVRASRLPHPWHVACTALLIFGALLVPLTPLGVRALSRPWATGLAWVGYSWMGLVFVAFVTLVFSEFVRPLMRLGLIAMGDSPKDPARRLFLSRATAGGVAAVTAGLGGVALWQANRAVAVKPVKVLLDKLPSELSGFRIVQLTDIHIGAVLQTDFVEYLVERSNALNPDIVAITGDLVDGSVAALGPLVRPLQRLRAAHGVYFVTGNHEYYSGAEQWVEFLNSIGIRVLRNERLRIERNGAALDLAGVDDWSAHRFGIGHGADMERALANRDAAVPVVLLAHQPRAIHEAAEYGVDLQISGHTHGGQMFPFNYLVYLQQPYVAGLHRHGASQIYVSKGTGYWGPPMRLGIPAEITDIRLHARKTS